MTVHACMSYLCVCVYVPVPGHTCVSLCVFFVCLMCVPVSVHLCVYVCLYKHLCMCVPVCTSVCESTSDCGFVCLVYHKSKRNIIRY